MILGSLTYNSLLSLRILFFTRNVEELKMVDPSAVAIKENSRMQVDDMPRRAIKFKILSKDN